MQHFIITYFLQKLKKKIEVVASSPSRLCLATCSTKIYSSDLVEFRALINKNSQV